MTRMNGTWFCVLRLFAIWNARKIVERRFSASDGCVARLCVFFPQINKNPSNEICQLQSKLHRLNTWTRITVLMQEKSNSNWAEETDKISKMIVSDDVSFKTSSKIIASKWVSCSFDCHCAFLWNFLLFRFLCQLIQRYEFLRDKARHLVHQTVRT